MSQASEEGLFPSSYRYIPSVNQHLPLLQQWLQTNELRIVAQLGDGNCWYHCLAKGSEFAHGDASDLRKVACSAYLGDTDLDIRSGDGPIAAKSRLEEGKRWRSLTSTQQMAELSDERHHHAQAKLRNLIRYAEDDAEQHLLRDGSSATDNQIENAKQSSRLAVYENIERTLSRMDYALYMLGAGVYADAGVMQALAKLFKIQVIVFELTVSRGAAISRISLRPYDPNTYLTVFLFRHNQHYDLVIPANEPNHAHLIGADQLPLIIFSTTDMQESVASPSIESGAHATSGLSNEELGAIQDTLLPLTHSVSIDVSRKYTLCV
jgi:hypothetical protein